MDDELVEAMARAWCEANGHTFDWCPFAPKHRENARRVVLAVRGAGFSIVATEDWETARALVDPDGDWE